VLEDPALFGDGGVAHEGEARRDLGSDRASSRLHRHEAHERRERRLVGEHLVEERLRGAVDAERRCRRDRAVVAWLVKRHGVWPSVLFYVGSWREHGAAVADAVWSTECHQCSRLIALNGATAVRCELCREPEAPASALAPSTVLLPPSM